MRSLCKMAAVTYFPSIHDNTTDNKKIWALFYPKQPKCDRSGSAFQRVHAEAAWTPWGRLAVPDYQPLDAFSATAEDPGSASCGEAEEVCELSIRLKEIELRNMMEETPAVPECECTTTIITCAAVDGQFSMWIIVSVTIIQS